MRCCGGGSRTSASRCTRHRSDRRSTAAATGCASTRPETSSLDTDVVVFAAGVRPRDELARDAGLRVGERGGILVDEALPDERPGRISRSASAPRSTAAATASSPPATRWPTWSSTGCSAVPRVRRCRHLDQAQAARRRRGQLRRHDRPARRRVRRPGPRPVRQAGAHRRRADAARRDPGRRRVRLRPLRAAVGGPVPGKLADFLSAGVAGRDAARRRRRCAAATTSPRTPIAGRDRRRMRRRGRASRRAPGPAPPAGPAYRCSSPCSPRPASRSPPRCASTSRTPGRSCST